MTVASILGQKQGATLVSCKPSDNLEFIAKRLAEHRIGAIFVVDDKEALVGIVSERDIVRKMASAGSSVVSNTAADIMTKKVVTCLPGDNITMLMGLMTENRIRHVPVVVDGKVEGVVSIGDVVKARIAATEREAAEMMQYISSAG